MKKVVVTGATGFIGLHLIEKWNELGADIYAVIRPNSKNASRIPNKDNIHIIELSLNEYSNLPDIIHSADCFYHLAWEGARAPFRDDADMQKSNYECAIQAYEAAIKLGCSLFLGSGSQAEYGLTAGIIDETYPCNPTTEYGKQKLNTCKVLLDRAVAEDIRFIWTRIFSIYGPYDYPGTLVMTSVDKMLKGECIEMTEGNQLWDYLYVSDAASAMVLLATNKSASGIYNIASGEYKPLKAYIEEMKNVLKSNSEVNYGAIPYGPQGPLNLTPDSSKVRMLGWKPNVSFEDGIKEIAKSLVD